MADKNMIDAEVVRLETHELHLYSLTAVYQKKPVLYFYQLGRGMSTISRHCATGT